MAAEGEDMKTRERESGDGEEKETDNTKTITMVSLRRPHPPALGQDFGIEENSLCTYILIRKFY